MAGFDEDLAKFQELADGGSSDNQRGNARADDGPAADEASEPTGGRLPTIQEETDADLDAHIMEEWYQELTDECELKPELIIDSHYGPALYAATNPSIQMRSGLDGMRRARQLALSAWKQAGRRRTRHLRGTATFLRIRPHIHTRQ